MEITAIILFYAVIVLLGFLREFRMRSKRENAFYLGSIVLSLAVILYESITD